MPEWRKCLQQDFFGGVTAFNLEQLRKVNGYGNRYWGWGREDDNMRERLKRSDMWPPDKPLVPKRSARYYFRHTQHQKALEVRPLLSSLVSNVHIIHAPSRSIDL